MKKPCVICLKPVGEDPDQLGLCGYCQDHAVGIIGCHRSFVDVTRGDMELIRWVARRARKAAPAPAPPGQKGGGQ